MQEVIIGVDIGGSKILSGIVTREGSILARKKKPTMADRDAGEIMDDICETVRELMQETRVKKEDILGVAVGAPGPLDHVTGIIKDPPNLGWRNLPLREQLSKRLGMQLLLENDANLAALGEWKFGSSKISRDLIYLTVSTGIGGGIIIDGKLYRGIDGGAGEFGRMRMETDSDNDPFRPNRCLEDLASGTAVAYEAEKLIKQGRGQAILKFCPAGSPITAREVGAAARSGVPEALAIIHRAGQYLGTAIANIVNIFNPDRVVIGGGTGLGLQDLLTDPIQNCLNSWVSSSMGHNLKIEFTALGENIGLLGCAAAVLQEIENKGLRKSYKSPSGYH